jgi:hypothetical protein
MIPEQTCTQFKDKIVRLNYIATRFAELKIRSTPMAKRDPEKERNMDTR